MFDVMITSNIDDRELGVITIDILSDLESCKQYDNEDCIFWILDYDNDGSTDSSYESIVKFAELFKKYIIEDEENIIYAMRDTGKYSAYDIMENVSKYDLWDDIKTDKDYGYYVAQEIYGVDSNLLSYIDLEKLGSDSLVYSEKEHTDYGLLVYKG